MPRLTYFVLGDWNAACDQCGRGFKFSALKKRWDGAWACSDCWEPRQPQDFVRGVKDDSSVPVGRPRILNLNYDVLLEDGSSILLESVTAGIGVSRVLMEVGP